VVYVRVGQEEVEAEWHLGCMCWRSFLRCAYVKVKAVWLSKGCVIV